MLCEKNLNSEATEPSRFRAVSSEHFQLCINTGQSWFEDSHTGRSHNPTVPYLFCEIRRKYLWTRVAGLTFASDLSAGDTKTRFEPFPISMQTRTFISQDLCRTKLGTAFPGAGDVNQGISISLGITSPQTVLKLLGKWNLGISNFGLGQPEGSGNANQKY